MVAGWAYRQVLEDVVLHNQNDHELVRILTEKMEADSLLMEFQSPEIAVRITGAIKKVVEGILSGVMRSGLEGKPSGTPYTVQQYREGLQELLELIPSGEQQTSGTG